MSKRTTWVLIPVLAVALALGWRLMPASRDAQAGGAYPPAVVELADVREETAPRLLHAVGELEAWRQVQLSAETSGRIRDIRFESGQPVKAGQPLLLLNDELEQASLRRQQAQLKQAALQLERVRRLKAEQAATQEQLDQARADHDMAQAQVQHDRAQLALKQVNAPFAGRIGITHLHPGHYLQPGQAIASLVDDSRLRVNLTVPEHVLPELSVGQALTLQVDAWPGRTFQARIAAIDPLVGASRTVRLQAILPNEDGRLQAGMYARARIPRPAGAPVLSVPETALTYTAYGQTVFVAFKNEQDQWQAKRVSVQTGERWDERVEIIQGLEVGDTVVSAGQIKLQDGSLLQPAAGGENS
ncbi:MAG: efflux RND transporter periplasmic adaptor subunit [Alcaligenes sp.]